MGILAHAEKHEIKNGLATVIQTCNAANLRLGLLHGNRLAAFSEDAMHVRIGNF